MKRYRNYNIHSLAALTLASYHFSPVRRADTIVVADNDQIIKQGLHYELFANKAEGCQ